MALSKIDVANMLTGEVPNANVADLPQSKLEDNINFRNILINGDMAVSQRATSTASLTSGSNFVVDRTMWQIGTAVTWTVSQDTDVPTGQGFASSLKLDCTTANGSLSAGSYGILVQRIEGQNLQYLAKGTSDAKSTTLSFWVKTNLTGTYQVNLNDSDNTRIIGTTYTVSVADTWEKKTLTFAGDTTGALGNDTGNALQVEWWFIAGSTYSGGAVPTSWEATVTTDRSAASVNLSSSTSNYLNITGIQLEAATVASDFEVIPYGQNLQRCQRYYIKLNSEIYGNNDKAGTNTNMQNFHMFRVVMRAAPTITVGTGSNWTSGPTGASPTVDGFRIYGAGDGAYIDPPGYIAAAEL